MIKIKEQGGWKEATNRELIHRSVAVLEPDRVIIWENETDNWIMVLVNDVPVLHIGSLKSKAVFQHTLAGLSSPQQPAASLQSLAGAREKRAEVEASPKKYSGLTRAAEAINEWAERKGWNQERSFGDTISLMHSELTEAFEQYRDDKGMLWFNKEEALPEVGSRLLSPVILSKPEGIAIELVDCLIRILHFMAQQELDVDSLLKMKMEYNELRPHRHGGKQV